MFTKIFNSLVILIVIIALSSCKNSVKNQNPPIDYKQEMRLFVRNISSYAKSFKPNFYIIPQNGHNLVTISGDNTDDFALDYLNAIDGMGREDLFYGYNQDNSETPESETQEMLYFLNVGKNFGKKILVTDYCYSHSKIDSSYRKNARNGFISYAATHRELDNIPAYPENPYNENNIDVDSLSYAKNFLYLLNNTQNYQTKEEFISAINQTNYDLIIMDLFFDDTQFTAREIDDLKHKKKGGKRLLIAYMSIGEAEDYRYYWQNDWKDNPPSWLCEENPNWEGNYKVKYWQKGWQDIIFGNDNSYLKKIIDANFDGVYLDIIDAFEYFEEK